MELELWYQYSVFTHTLTLSNVQDINIYQPILTHLKNLKGYMGQQYP